MIVWFKEYHESRKRCLRWKLGSPKCWFSGLDLEFGDQKGLRQDQRSEKLEDKAELRASVEKSQRFGNQEGKAEMERGNWFWVAKRQSQIKRTKDEQE